MWLKLDDGIIEHPKMYAAGRHLGAEPTGRQRAFCVFCEGLAWVNRHLTDGFIPAAVVQSLRMDRRPGDVAAVLALEDVRLWERVDGGFQIHDYHDWNPSADEVREFRKKKSEAGRRGGILSAELRREARSKTRSSCSSTCLSKREASASKKGHKSGSTCSSKIQARARAIPIPIRTTQKITGADAPGQASWLHYVKTAHDAIDASWQTDQSDDLGNIAEWFRILCARRHLTYDDPQLPTKAIDAALQARQKDQAVTA